MKEQPYDVIGDWSQMKLDIIREYDDKYTTILARQRNPSFTFMYIDAFAGAGKHFSRRTGELVSGSPLNALNVKNHFDEYHFVDLDDAKVAELEGLAGERKGVFVYHGDCNEILPKEILPLVRFDQYRRALCILDPYGLHLNWELIMKAGQMQTVDIFLNFPIMDINMNVLKHDQSKVDSSQVARMNAYWGDDSWRQISYVPPSQNRLPGFGEAPDEKTSNSALESAFRTRLKKVADFKYVPEPFPMRNSNNAIVYYLYFASQKAVAAKVAEAIFKKYSLPGTK